MGGLGLGGFLEGGRWRRLFRLVDGWMVGWMGGKGGREGREGKGESRGIGFFVRGSLLEWQNCCSRSRNW